MKTRRQQLETLNLQNGKAHWINQMYSKGNYPHTNTVHKPVTVRGGKYKFRIFEMHLKLRDQQLKQSYIYVCVCARACVCVQRETAISKPHGNHEPKNYKKIQAQH